MTQITLKTKGLLARASMAYYLSGMKYKQLNKQKLTTVV
jgi:hypothetical protein